MTDVKHEGGKKHVNVSTHYLLNNFYSVHPHEVGVPKVGHASRWLQALLGMHLAVIPHC